MNTKTIKLDLEIIFNSGTDRIIYPGNTNYRLIIIQVIYIKSKCNFFPGFHTEFKLVKYPVIIEIIEKGLIKNSIDHFRIAHLVK